MYVALTYWMFGLFLGGNLAPTYEFWISPAMLHEHWYVFTCPYSEIDLVESWEC
jgi:hypothetical protein